MDDMSMPEPYWETINGSWHGGYHPDQLRAERIAAYELGRNAGLEEAASKCDGHWHHKTDKVSEEIRNLKR